MSRPLPLSALRAFEAAARTGSFRAAADDLSLTPSAVSHAIRGLEQTLNRAAHYQAVTVTELGRAGLTDVRRRNDYAPARPAITRQHGRTVRGLLAGARARKAARSG